MYTVPGNPLSATLDGGGSSPVYPVPKRQPERKRTAPNLRMMFLFVRWPLVECFNIGYRPESESFLSGFGTHHGTECDPMAVLASGIEIRRLHRDHWWLDNATVHLLHGIDFHGSLVGEDEVEIGGCVLLHALSPPCERGEAVDGLFQKDTAVALLDRFAESYPQETFSPEAGGAGNRGIEEEVADVHPSVFFVRVFIDGFVDEFLPILLKRRQTGRGSQSLASFTGVSDGDCERQCQSREICQEQEFALSVHSAFSATASIKEFVAGIGVDIARLMGWIIHPFSVFLVIVVKRTLSS